VNTRSASEGMEMRETKEGGTISSRSMVSSNKERK